MENGDGFNPDGKKKSSLMSVAAGLGQKLFKTEEPLLPDVETPNNPLKQDQNPKLYLRKHLEQVNNYPEESEDNPRTELFRPLVGELRDENGIFQFKGSNIEITYQHQPVDVVSGNERGPYARVTEPGGFQLVSDVEIKHPSDNYIINVNELLPGYSIYLNPQADNLLNGDKSYVDKDKKEVFIYGNPLNMATWLTTAHEIGHVKDSFQNGSAEISQEYGHAVARARDMRADAQDTATWLRGERNPWAYAIKLLKPFIGEDQPIRKEALHDMIHNRNLALYSEKMEYHSGPARWAEIYDRPYTPPRMGRPKEENAEQ